MAQVNAPASNLLPSPSALLALALLCGAGRHLAPRRRRGGPGTPSSGLTAGNAP